jgi:hypothetical protein
MVTIAIVSSRRGDAMSALAVRETLSVIADASSESMAAQSRLAVAAVSSGCGGHFHCSPKARDSFRLFGPTTVAYDDLLGV